MIRVLVVDDHAAVRAGLDALLRREPGLVPVCCASDTAAALHAVGRDRIDVALVDHQLAEEDGVTLTQAFGTLETAPAVILYAGRVDAYLEIVGRLAGAVAVMPKGAPARELFDVIRRVARGESVRPAEPARLLATAGVVFEEADRPIVALLLDGTGRADAAAALGIDPPEFEARVNGMLDRLAARRERPAAPLGGSPADLARQPA